MQISRLKNYFRCDKTKVKEKSRTGQGRTRVFMEERTTGTDKEEKERM